MNRNAVFAGSGAAVAGGLVAMGLAVAGFALWGVMDRDSTTATVPDAVPSALPSQQAAPEVQATPAPSPTPDTPADPALRLPEFALVRVEPDGFAQVAGSAEPGRMVELLLDETLVGQAMAGPDGNFAALLDLPPSDAPRMMRLRMVQDAGAVISAQEVIIAPSPRTARPAEPQDAVTSAARTSEAAQPQTAPDPVTPTVGQTTETEAAAPVPEPAPAPVDMAAAPPAPSAQVVQQAPQPAQTSQPVADAPIADAPAPTTAAQDQTTVAPQHPVAAPPTVLLSDSDGVRVIQSGGAPQVMDTVAIDAITYSDSGEVELTGRSPGQGFVRIYLDNAPITTAPVAPDGSWQSDLPQVDSGIYTLRVDQVDAQGAVASRVETPFKREDSATLAAASAAPASAARAITVQPGYTLWAIARDRYGEGIRYVEVYDANRDRIRDPDLIYPGQVFDLPSEP